MKPYFCKYLPVLGEIEEGDKFIDKGPLGLILTARIPEGWSNPHISYYDSYQKVKLFLCSRDIQVGDKINEGVIVDSIEMGSGENHYPKELIVWHVDKDDNSIKYWLKLKDCFKVIGEISSDAIWVKEGDEFDKDELMQNGTGVNITAGGSTLRIKCPTCKHFH